MIILIRVLKGVIVEAIENLTFIPLKEAALIEEIAEENIKTTYHKKYNSNKIRFKKDEDGNLLVALNYKYPLKEILSNLYYKALIVSRTQANLCKQLSKKTSIKTDTLHHYFTRFTFKNVEKALIVIAALQEYIKENSLFTTGELNYD